MGIKMSDLKVTEKAHDPLIRVGECFFCAQPIGKDHRPDCVNIKKRVKVKMIVEYEVCVPAHWDKSAVEYHRNDGTWCADNVIDELEIISDKNGCLCDSVKFEYIEDVGDKYLEE